MLRYRIHKHGLYYWFNQVGRNGKTLTTSEMYKSKRGMMGGVLAASAGNYYVIVNKLK